MEDKLIRMFGFYDGSGKLIEMIPSSDIETAKDIYNKENPDNHYYYVEVLY